MKTEIETLAQQLFERDFLTEKEIVKLIRARLKGMIERAEMWEALNNQERLRVVAEQGVGEEKYQYLNIEMWTRNLSSDKPDVQIQSEYARSTLNAYARAQVKALKKK